MRVLFVVLGTKRVAASRYRVYQYLPFLEAHGLRCSVISIISNFTTRLSINSPEFGETKRLVYYILFSIEKFFRFWVIFFIAPYFDLIFLQRVTFPFGFGRLLRLRNRKIIFDIDDAIFLPDTQRQNLISRFKTFVKEKELIGILCIANCVIVENDYIKDYVSKYCDKVYKIRGPIDTERYFVKEKGSCANKKEGVTIGWIGSPATTVYLHLLDSLFAKVLHKSENIRIVLIGAGDYSFPSEKVIKKRWSYETEVEELQNFDIGIMPMPNDEWTKGKLGCKMLQYMAVGVPSVVSYTPTNAEIIRDGENGFLVNSLSEWLDRLSDLMEDASLRASIGASGRQTVEGACSIQKNAPRLLEIFRSLNGI